MDDDELIGPLEREMRRRDSLPFDGIMGNLPNWVPDNFQRKFHTIRDRLLGKYTHKHLLDSLDKGIAEARNLRGMLTGKPMDITTGPFEFSEVTGMSEASFLVRMMDAVLLGPEKGLALLTDPDHAKTAKIGANNRIGQTEKAKLLRGKVGEDGKTINEIIEELAVMPDHRNYTAKEIWNPFISALKERDLEPEENETSSEWTKWTICYDYKEGRKTITGGRFANVVYEARKHKKTR